MDQKEIELLKIKKRRKNKRLAQSFAAQFASLEASPYWLDILTHNDCLIELEEEYQFDVHRKWRLDFAIPSLRIGVEIEGGTWISGRHNRGGSYRLDCEKYNEATAQGWKIFRFTTTDIKDESAIGFIFRVLSGGRRLPSRAKDGSCRNRREKRVTKKNLEIL